MRFLALLTLPLVTAGCAAFQSGATPAEAAAAEDQIVTAGAMLAPWLGPIAPFAPLAAGIAVQIGRLIRNKK